MEEIKIIIYLLLFVCSCSKYNAFSKKNTLNKELYKVQREKITVGLEVCNINDINFCSDGFEQDYRLANPFFVDVLGDMIKSYEDKLYSLDILSVADTIRKLGIDIQDRDSLSTVVDFMLKSKNTYKIEIPLLRKFYNKQDNYLDIVRKFDGYYYYVIVEIDMSFFYGGKRNVAIPNFNYKGKDPIIILKSDVFYITEIHNYKYVQFFKKKESGVPPQEPDDQ